MEQAKWYYINFGCYIQVYGLLRDIKTPFRFSVLLYQLKDAGIKRIGRTIIDMTPRYIRGRGAIWNFSYVVPVFCGQKKLNKLIEEAHLLGLEDELLIFERK